MNTLPTQLKIAGFTHTQIDRDGDLAIYRQSKEGQHDSYEVIRIQSHEAAEIPNGDGTFRTVEAGETYPKANSWGRDGWTHSSLQVAKWKFDALIQAREFTNPATP